jgi:hypothetical protein
MTMKASRMKSPRPIVVAALSICAVLSGSARAADGAPSGVHWSGLPIWGAEAEARGYQLPNPFGIGITAYSARQP